MPGQYWDGDQGEEKDLGDVGDAVGTDRQRRDLPALRRDSPGVSVGSPCDPFCRYRCQAVCSLRVA